MDLRAVCLVRAIADDVCGSDKVARVFGLRGCGGGGRSDGGAKAKRGGYLYGRESSAQNATRLITCVLVD